MLLNEIMNNPVDWDIKRDTKDDFYATFIVDDIELIFTVKVQPNDNNIHHVKFFIIDDDGNEFIGLLNKGYKFSSMVYSTVVSILDYYVNKYYPDELRFTAKEPSRIKLYDRMVNMLVDYGYYYDSKTYPSGKRYILSK